MYKFKVEKYMPTDDVENYYIIRDNERNVDYIAYSGGNINYCIQIKEKGYAPKSGLVFYDIIEREVKGKRVLDLGCGETGILGIHSLNSGAESVDSVDFDQKCIEWLKKIIDDNALKDIRCYKSNWFSDVSDKFDVILSNPPQMPMQGGAIHDGGGVDGKKHIIEIINQAPQYLNNDGKLFLLVFNFLGIHCSAEGKCTIEEIGRQAGFCDIKTEKTVLKEIRPGSITYKSLEYIKSVYPEYSFYKKDGRLYNEISVVSMKYNSNRSTHHF